MKPSRYFVSDSSEPIRWGPHASKSIKEVEDGTFKVGNSRGRNTCDDVKKQKRKRFVNGIVDNLRSRFLNV